MPESIKITEQPSYYRNLDKMPVPELLININKEDKTVPFAVEKAIPQIEKLIIAITAKLLSGGRLFYIGAGSSGRNCIADASECSPTFGVSSDLIIAVMAGGPSAFTKAAEFAEDDEEQAWKDLEEYYISDKDVILGVSASGTTPYVVSALQKCRKENITTGCITSNINTPLAGFSDYPVEVITGPELITGSTRMKSGTAQKLVLNMISTSVMIQLGKIKDNKMINMQLTNNKLIDRGTKMLMEQLHINDYKQAKQLLLKNGSVQKAIAAEQKFII